LAGFSATLSGEDVKRKSKSVTETHNTHFPLTVPAGEGRIVDEKTTVTSTTIVFESGLFTGGTVGIEVDPGDWEANIFYFFYEIASEFPDAVATSRISRFSLKTDISVTILQLRKKTDEKKAEIVEYHSSDSDIAAIGFEDIGIAVSPTEAVKASSPGQISPFLVNMKIRVQFAGVKPEVPLEKRQVGTEKFRAHIALNVHPIGKPSAINYTSNFGSASFSIPYNPQQISNADLGAAVIKQAQGVQWGGKYTINFS
jgi:hypothetical protein